ncbi:MAG: hypothetical protein U0667_08480 [Chloroflexota bacterium]
MPANAYGVLALFTIVSVLCGLAAAWVVGPRRPRAAIVPALGAFLALYWVGHRSGLELGPTLELFGFRIALVQDVVAGALGALVAALVQRAVLDRRARRGTQAR